MSEQVIAPRIRGFLCLTNHPEGCAENVRQQIDYIQDNFMNDCDMLHGKNKTTLVIGSSTGYGLSSLLTKAFGCKSETLGVCFEKAPDERRAGSAGWYNLAEAHRLAKKENLHMETINGDAFSHEIKAQVVEALKARYSKIDTVVYSLASPKRKDPDSDTVWSSVLKPVGDVFNGKTINLKTNEIENIEIPAASEQEQADTVKVMGGEDWKLWIDCLLEAGVLAEGCRTVAYSYIGPKVTFPIYRSGTIGGAKEHLEKTGIELNNLLSEKLGGNAWVSVNKALVTQASSAIPVVPLYISILFKIMKKIGNHEGCVEQIVRLFKEHLCTSTSPTLDSNGRIRIDDLEMSEEVQSKVDDIWENITTDNLNELSDFASFEKDFKKLFGFEVDSIDYNKAVETLRELE